ncbi:MAG TPA: PDZ domain-containing protein [Proteobacteria bacterium]|nr:PDZ domain-containing protein [Pseudomonadota bacterium]
MRGAGPVVIAMAVVAATALVACAPGYKVVRPGSGTFEVRVIPADPDRVYRETLNMFLEAGVSISFASSRDRIVSTGYIYPDDLEALSLAVGFGSGSNMRTKYTLTAHPHPQGTALRCVIQKEFKAGRGAYHRIPADWLDYDSLYTRLYMRLGSAMIGAGMGYKNDRGPPLEIRMIIPDTPAECAGLMVGDVVLEADGRPVNYMFELYEVLLGKGSGDSVKLTIQRAGKQFEVTVPVLACP